MANAAKGKNQVLCDVEVDAADLHLLLAPRILARHHFYAGHQAVVREDSCLKGGE
jgi:MinD superfamily P-loop ATPase